MASRVAQRARRGKADLGPFKDAEKLIDEARRAEHGAYQDAVSEIAQDAINDHPGDEDEQMQRIESDVESYCTYTRDCIDVLRFTDNDDAIFDEMGKDALDGEDSAVSIYCKIANFALRADVLDEWNNLDHGGGPWLIRCAKGPDKGKFWNDSKDAWVDLADATEFDSKEGEDLPDDGGEWVLKSDVTDGKDEDEAEDKDEDEEEAAPVKW